MIHYKDVQTFAPMFEIILLLPLLTDTKVKVDLTSCGPPGGQEELLLQVVT